MQTTIRLTSELYQRIKETAAERGMTINAVVAQVLWEYFLKSGR